MISPRSEQCDSGTGRSWVRVGRVTAGRTISRVSAPLRQLLARPVPRRIASVSTVAGGSALLGATASLWAPAAAALDLARSGRRFPLLRGLGFAWAWSSLETVGVAAATGLAVTGHGDDADAHYALQRWWTARIVDSLRVFASLRVEVDGLDALAPGPLVLCSQHVSIIDSLLPAWLLAQVGMRPRFVLKDDLLIDPCLDIVGHRVPNHFVDRSPDDLDTELAAFEDLARGMGGHDAAVIFPEGMVVTPERRAQAFERLRTRDPARADRLSAMEVLAPVRPAGTRALLRGAPDADVAFVTHRGLESLRRLADAAQAVPLRDPVRVQVTRCSRRDVPEADADVAAWLDEQWLAADGKLSH